MEEQDTQEPRAPQPDSDRLDRSAQTDDAQSEPARPEAGTASGAREDDRNDELDQSPAPDPEEKDAGTDDDPTAD
jgi:hypothetical protein